MGHQKIYWAGNIYRLAKGVVHLLKPVTFGDLAVLSGHRMI